MKDLISTTILLYPKVLPLSQSITLGFPLSSILVTTFFISHGARNCPFFTFTGSPVSAAAMSKSVCLHKNAGICIRSTTSATFLHCHTSCTSVTTGRSYISFTFCNILSPSSIPGPLYEWIDDLLALSKEALNI